MVFNDLDSIAAILLLSKVQPSISANSFPGESPFMLSRSIAPPPPDLVSLFKNCTFFALIDELFSAFIAPPPAGAKQFLIIESSMLSSIRSFVHLEYGLNHIPPPACPKQFSIIEFLTVISAPCSAEIPPTRLPPSRVIFSRVSLVLSYLAPIKL